MLSSADKAIRVKQVYTELDRKFEEQETQRQAQQQKFPYLNLYGYPVDNQALALLPKETAEAVGACIFYKEGRHIKIAIRDIDSKVGPVMEKLVEDGYNGEVYLVSLSSFNHLLEGYAQVLKTTRKSDKIEIISGQGEHEAQTLKDLAKKLSNVSASEFINAVMGSALGINSSDIHIEPEGQIIKVRFRIDGVLQDVASINREIYQVVVSRIKILSKLKLNITTVPQDGSFSLTYDGKQVDIRVSVLPSTFGESIVMRILRQDKGGLKFEDLGIMGLAKERLIAQMQKPNGMILTTGPTGSGKTTTLYAMLNKLNEPGVKIITLEDPVEYKIEGITQTPIDTAAGMTFASGLRAILRQDPDIIMVGEMRDLETAETAAQAALTGHIVLSTLHTNDAPAAIPRLLDLGIRSFVLAPAINAVIAQRLVRKICDKCKTKYELPANLRARVEMMLSHIPKASKTVIPTKLEFYHSTGCPECKGIGYKGRLGVYEVFSISETIEQMINNSATATEIRKQAIEEGMITMGQDAVLKALTGITDIEEVFRVVEE
jgi:type II secretory ATPase GspE/PulE/Tfp pilus assembly ATPase PilB-like protein